MFLGFDVIWQKAQDTGRADFFTSSWDMTVRNSLQAVLIGNIIGGNTGAYCTNQAYVQRLISCKSINHARGAAYLGTGSEQISLSARSLVGGPMNSYSIYNDCFDFMLDLWFCYVCLLRTLRSI